MATIVFLHGLNTYGDDLLHIGPISFGFMHSKLERAFREHDVDFIPVLNLGFASPEEQAERAQKFLDELGLLDKGASIHLLGQSIGGLVARALAARSEMNGHIKSLITMGTPHKGTQTAKFGMDFDERFPHFSRIAALCGYDTRAKARIFGQFTPESIDVFNKRFPPRTDIREIALICDIPKSDLSLPLLALHKHIHPTTAEGVAPSDGFVLCESQRHGEAMGPFALDHFGELGYFFHPSPGVRRRGETEFKRLVNTICSLVGAEPHHEAGTETMK